MHEYSQNKLLKLLFIYFEKVNSWYLPITDRIINIFLLSATLQDVINDILVHNSLKSKRKVQH